MRHEGGPIDLISTSNARPEVTCGAERTSLALSKGKKHSWGSARRERNPERSPSGRQSRKLNAPFRIVCRRIIGSRAGTTYCRSARSIYAGWAASRSPRFYGNRAHTCGWLSRDPWSRLRRITRYPSLSRAFLHVRSRLITRGAALSSLFALEQPLQHQGDDRARARARGSSDNRSIARPLFNHPSFLCCLLTQKRIRQ